MCEVAEHGGMSVVHAEDDAIANWLTGKYLREGKTHGAYISETRGPLVEEAATRRDDLPRGARGLAALRPAHGGGHRGRRARREARARGLPMYGETLTRLPQLHAGRPCWDESPLEVDGEDVRRARACSTTTTPCPSSGRPGHLWEAIADDRLQVVATDHCSRHAQGPLRADGHDDRQHAGRARRRPRCASRCSTRRASPRAASAPAAGSSSSRRTRRGSWASHPRKGELAAGADADVRRVRPEQQLDGALAASST